ncbi:MAG: apolipoprotein N-acyltransferase [Micromonosporaceae bacterium]|nr:apolipoprotein N-acyltransferase [Micromonosporaceae bacterium]
METCGDVNFQNLTRSYAAAGATFMAIPASDEDVNGRQHAVAGMLRGIENGLSIAWSGQRGTLMLSDAYGRVLGEDRTDQSRPFVTAIAAVPPGSGATFYTRTGDWFRGFAWRLRSPPSFTASGRDVHATRNHIRNRFT